MLHPQMSALLSALAAAGYSDLSALPLDALRAAAREPYVPAGPPAYVRELHIPGPHGPLAARVFAPVQSPDALAGLLFFSAGFYSVGELWGHTALCQQLAVSADCVVISVAPRLAPEHKFPAAVDDAYVAACWVHENADEVGIDHRRLAIGGESTGATLATTVCRLAKERRNPALAFQLLLYPGTDLRPEAVARVQRAAQVGGEDPKHASPELTRLRQITAGALSRSIELYLAAAADAADPRCSPVAAKNLIGLPPALILSAEEDVLAPDVEAYVRLLQAAHVPVTLSRYAGVGHGFAHSFAFLDPGREALAECGAALRTALQAPRDGHAGQPVS
jgi:acetyl esterase